MSSLNLILEQLLSERDRIDSAIKALRGVSLHSGAPRKRRTMSTAARKRIAAAQKARWAKWKKAKG